LSTVAIVAVPEQTPVPVPLPSVALVGALVYWVPAAVMVSVAPPAMTPPVMGTLAVAPVPPPLNELRVQVPVPAVVPPLVYVPEATTEFCK